MSLLHDYGPGITDLLDEIYPISNIRCNHCKQLLYWFQVTYSHWGNPIHPLCLLCHQYIT